MRKILIINWQDWTNPLSGGAEVHLREIFTRLTQFFDIHLLCCHFKGAKRFEILEGIKIHRYGKRFNFNYVVPLAWHKKFKQEGFHLIIEDLNKLPFLTMFYTGKTKKLAILHHFFGESIFYETNPLLGSYVLFFEKLVPKLYRGIKFICVSESSKEDLIKGGIKPEDIFVIYNGIDSKYFCKEVPQKYERPTVLYLGRLKRYKRIHLVLEAFKEIKKELRDAQLFVVGDGDAKPFLEKYVKKLNLNDVIFKGFVPEEEKIKILRKSWVILNTSPKEGFGLVVAEAQASGTPAIVFNSPGLRETIKNNETGFIVENLKEMVFRTKELLQSPILRDKMSKNAIEWAKRFSWDESAKKIYDIITSIWV